MEKLSQIAAMAARDAIDGAVRQMESKAKEKLIAKDMVSPSAYAYFEAQRDGYLEAAHQLSKFRAELHKRVFDAYVEEHGKDGG